MPMKDVAPFDFGPLARILKPTTFMTLVTPGCCSSHLLICSLTCFVSVWEMPSGKVTFIMTKALSSDGTKPVGMILKTPAVRALMMTRKATHHLGEAASEPGAGHTRR